MGRVSVDNGGVALACLGGAFAMGFGIKGMAGMFGAMYTHLLFASRGREDMKALYGGVEVGSRNLSQKRQVLE